MVPTIFYTFQIKDGGYQYLSNIGSNRFIASGVTSKTGLMMLSFGPKFSRKQEFDGSSSIHWYTSMMLRHYGCDNGWLHLGTQKRFQNPKCIQFSNVLDLLQFGPRPKCSLAPGSNAIQPQAQMQLSPGLKWDWAPDPNGIAQERQMRLCPRSEMRYQCFSHDNNIQLKYQAIGYSVWPDFENHFQPS